MHNYTLQCFGKVAALTNDKGLHLAAFPLSTGSHVGPILIPGCIKSLDMNGMTIELLDNYHVKFSRGSFYCTLVGLNIDDEPGDISEEGYMPSNLSYKDRESKKYFVYFDPPKPKAGAELLKLVPASHKKAAKYMPEYGFVSCGFLTVTKTTNHTEVQRTVLKTVDYWGGVEPLKGLVKPFERGCDAVRIDFDGLPIILGYDNAKLVEKLSKKATFGLSTLGHLVAHLDGILYILSGLDPKTKPYITLTLNTVMEQVA